VLIPVIVVLGLYLSPYVLGRVDTPIGGDTPWYIARQRLVAEQGLDAIGERTGEGPRRAKTLGDRPGYPVVASVVSGLTGVDEFEIAYVLPAAVAVTVALAAGGFAIAVLREPGWAFVVYAIAVGGSTLIARTAVQSHDNLLADTLLLAGGAAALMAAAGHGTRVAAIVLLTGASLTHWRFLVPFLLLLGVIWTLMIPDLVRRVRAGESVWEAPATRLGSVIVGTLGAGAAALWLAPSFSLELPKVRAVRVRKKTEEWVPGLRLPVLGTAAGVGLVSRWWPGNRLRRWGLVMMALWALSVPLSIALSEIASRNVPVYRVAAFALGIPVLAAAALVGLVVLGRRIAIVVAALGALLALLGLAVGLRLAWDVWSEQEPVMERAEVDQLTAAAGYLRASGVDGPVIFVVEVGTSTPSGRAIRAVLPTQLAERAYVYLGPVENLLEGRPTLRNSPKFNRDSTRWWRTIQPILDRDPVILLAQAYAADLSAALGTRVAPGLTVIRGPEAPPGFEPPVFVPPTDERLLVGSGAVLLALGLVGAGWSIALLPTGGLVRVAFAPAFGVATLAVVGLVADRIGVSLGGAGAVGIGIVTALGGLGAAVLMIRRAPREPDVEPVQADGSAAAGEAVDRLPSHDPG
jgi:hypothetical protein